MPQGPFRAKKGLVVNAVTGSVTVHIAANDAILVPVGNTADRPTGTAGLFRYNSQSGQFEGYTTDWGAIAGSGQLTIANTSNKPSSPADGDQWYNTSTGEFCVYFDDGDTSQWVQQNGSPGTNDYDGLNGMTEPINVSLATSATSNALTISLKTHNDEWPTAANPIYIPFRSSTETSGVVTWREVSANVNLTISDGSTLGVTAAEAFRIWITAWDDAGTIKLGAINCVEGNSSVNSITHIHSLEEWGLGSATAEGGVGGADSAGVHYANSTITSKAFRILGFIEYSTSGLTTAGVWNTTNLLRTSLFSSGMHKPGDIVQTSVAYHNTVASTTSGTYISTGDTVAISPKSAANIMKVAALGDIYNDTAFGQATVRFSRGTTAATNMFGNEASTASGGGSIIAPAAIQGFDKPDTTSSTSYAVQIKRLTAGTSSWLVNNTNGVLKVEEIMG